MWVGGTAGVWSSKVKGEDSQLSFKVMPEFGYILNSNLGLGIAIGAAHTHGGLDFDGNDLTSKGSRNEYKVNPFVRYTFLKSDQVVYFLTEVLLMTGQKELVVELKRMD